MIEKIIHKKKLFALIIRKKFRKKKGISFFTDDELNQQIGYMKHKKKHVILPHKHNKRSTTIMTTSEVIVMLKGTLRVDFYNNKHNYLFSKLVHKNDIIMLVYGGHGFKVISDVEMIEVKQGPYSIAKDKTKFDFVNENKIRIKK